MAQHLSFVLTALFFWSAVLDRRRGVGQAALCLFVTSLVTKDPGPIQSFVLFVAVMYVFVNLVVDLLYGLADPRIRLR